MTGVQDVVTLVSLTLFKWPFQKWGSRSIEPSSSQALDARAKRRILLTPMGYTRCTEGNSFSRG